MYRINFKTYHPNRLLDTKTLVDTCPHECPHVHKNVMVPSLIPPMVDKTG